MSGAARVLFVIALVVMLIGLAFAAYYYSGVLNQTSLLSSTLAALETEKVELAADVEKLEGWNSYMATQIGAHQLVLRDLEATAGMDTGNGPTPTFTLTPLDIIYGVMIEGNSCCVGGTAGETIDVVVQFQPDWSELESPAVEMRVITGVANVTAADMVNQPWEPVVAEKAYQVYVPTNWTTFWVHVQYRTAEGVVSLIYSDEIGVEGMPAQTIMP
jgi:hypothetical protein